MITLAFVTVISKMAIFTILKNFPSIPIEVGNMNIVLYQLIYIHIGGEESYINDMKRPKPCSYKNRKSFTVSQIVSYWKSERMLQGMGERFNILIMFVLFSMWDDLLRGPERCPPEAADSVQHLPQPQLTALPLSISRLVIP